MWDYKLFSKNIAFLDEAGSCLTYEELAYENDRMGEALNGRRLVFILCSNTLGAVVGYTGCIQNRSVPLLLAKDMDRALLDRLVEIYRPDLMWVPKELSSSFEGWPVVFEAFDYALLQTGYDKEYPLAEELCLLLTTSGSTGSPKVVRQSYRNVHCNAEAIAQFLKLDQTERPITTLPVYYTYGLSVINSHLLVGAAILLTEKSVVQKDFWTFFREKQATSFNGVPYTYEMLDKLSFTRMNLPSLRYMSQAGGKLQPELHRKFATYAEKNSKRFYIMYGQVEATTVMACLPHQKALTKCGSMGIAIPGRKFSLIDASGNEITTANIIGELVYEGPDVTMGYAERGEDLAKGDEWHGRLKTGDMAQIDADGYYYIVGRKARFLKIFGNRVSLDEIDQLVKEQFRDIDCASTGWDDKMYVFITTPSMEDQVRRFLSEKTGLNSQAFVVRYSDTIPRSVSGKVQYKELNSYMEHKNYVGDLQ